MPTKSAEDDPAKGPKLVLEPDDSTPAANCVRVRLDLSVTPDDLYDGSGRGLMNAMSAACVAAQEAGLPTARLRRRTRDDKIIAVVAGSRTASFGIVARDRHVPPGSSRGSSRERRRSSSAPRRVRTHNGSRGDPPREAGEPDRPPLACPCGCRKPPRHGSKYATDACGNRVRVRNHKARSALAVAVGDPDVFLTLLALDDAAFQRLAELVRSDAALTSVAA